METPMNVPVAAQGPTPNSFSAPYFFFSNQNDGIITFASTSLKEVMGFEPSEVIGKKFSDFVDSEHQLNANIGQCTEQRFENDNGEPQTYLRVLIAADKTRRVVNIQTYGEADETGKVILNHGIAQDVTNSFLLESNFNTRLTDLNSIVSQLTTREINVLERVLEGRLNKSIARELDVSERTIESARSRLMKKFKANTTAELVRYSTEFYMLTGLVKSVHGPECLPSKLNFLERVNSSSLYASSLKSTNAPKQEASNS